MEALKPNLNIIPYLILFVGVIVAIMYLANIDFTTKHEEVHQAIYRSHGIRSNIAVNWLDFSGVTTAGPIPVNLSEQEEAEMKLAHNINEAIGYQLTPVITLLAGVFGVLLSIMVCLILILFTRKS